jgi:protocatechuate 3,4-dioxygenase beta subunit
MTTRAVDAHALGLQHDLQMMAQRMHERRRAMSWLLAGGTAALASGCGGGSDDGNAVTGTTTGTTTGSTTTTTTTSTPTTSAAGSCTALPQETAGPFPSDGSNTVNGMASNVLTASGIVRRNIRGSFGTSTNTAGGVPLTLTLTLANFNNLCAPMVGAAVYLWHCTREGGYSLYTSGIQNENFLRGVQIADANGQVSFDTIFPAAYSGRYPHIHFEVYPNLAAATLYTNRTFTSQMAMPRDICSTVYANATGYGASVGNLAQTTLANDNVFGDNSTAQLAAMTPMLAGSVAAGYTGTLVIGVPA